MLTVFRCLQVFELNPIKAWSAIAITLTSVAASLYLISVSPWYLLPFAWFIAGTAFTGVSAFFKLGLSSKTFNSLCLYW